MNEKKDTVRKFWEGLDNGDLDSQLALLADDAVFTGDRHHGRIGHSARRGRR